MVKSDVWSGKKFWKQYLFGAGLFVVFIVVSSALINEIDLDLLVLAFSYLVLAGLLLWRWKYVGLGFLSALVAGALFIGLLFAEIAAHPPNEE